MSENVWFILAIIVELALAGGLFFAWKKLREVEDLLKNQKDEWLAQIIDGRQKLKEVNKYVDQLGLEGKMTIRPTTWQGKILWFLLSRKLAGNPVKS